MNEHPTSQLGAYYDGELDGPLLDSVEEHLSRCARCQAELEGYENLTSLMQSMPGPESISAVNVFTAQLRSRMPRQPDQPIWSRVFSLGWQMTPVAIVGIWSFVQAVFLVFGILFLASNLGLGGETLASLIPGSYSGPGIVDLFSFQGADLTDALQTGQDFLRAGGSIGWGMAVNLGVSITLGLLACSWLASWWIKNQSASRSAAITFNSNGY